MGYEETNSALVGMNVRLAALYERGEPETLIVHMRPQLHIISFHPLIYEKYGIIRNRAPVISGEVALREFLSRPHPDSGAVVYGGVQAENTGYGFRIDDLGVINQIAVSLGYPENAFV